MTPRTAAAWLAFGLLAACKDPAPSKPGTLDTDLPSDSGGADGSDGSDGAPCEISVVSIVPEDGTPDAFYRDPMSVVFDGTASTEASLVLYDADGAEVPSRIEWDETGLQATVFPAAPLTASADYQLDVAVCEATAQSRFTTGPYGTPLSVAHEELIGRTYHFNLGTAYYEEPEGLGGVLATFLRDPLLIGVASADAGTIEIIGTQGAVDETTGGIGQRAGFDVWNFGVADFRGSPYFASAPTDIAINYAGSDIPLYNFALEGTFSADGTSIGGAGASGQGDTRNMGPLVGLGADPNAICDLAAGFGVSCEDCPDGQPYCVTIIAHFNPAPQIDGLTLRE